MERFSARAPILGHSMPIFQGVWSRAKTYGVLRMWAACWAVLHLGVGLYVLTYYGFRWVLLLFITWILGHGLLVMLTNWHEKFDEMLMAQLRRRYKDHYEV